MGEQMSKERDLRAPYLLNLSTGQVQLYLDEQGNVEEVLSDDEYDADELQQFIDDIRSKLPQEDEDELELEEISDRVRERYESFIKQGFTPEESIKIACVMHAPYKTNDLWVCVQWLMTKGWTKEQAIEIVTRVL